MYTKDDTAQVSEIYHNQYQADSVSARALKSYSQISEVLLENAPLRGTALDVGSGAGALVRAFRSAGVDARGVEGSRHAVALCPDHITLHDLRTPLQCGQFDIVTCFDVGEHIENEYAQAFCQTIAGAMHNDSILYFGAAGEGQDGLGHVNCQHPCYWIGRFQDLGIELLPNLSEHVRRQIKAKPESNFLWWVDKNIMTLRRKRYGTIAG